MAPIRTALSEAELEVLKALWDEGAGTVRQLNEALRLRGREWAYTTVQTLLQRLLAKGYVRVETNGVAHVYQPSASRDELLRDRLNDLAEQLCEGAPTPLVLALVQGHRFSAEEIEHFRRMLDDLEGGGSGTAGPSGRSRGAESTKRKGDDR